MPPAVRAGPVPAPPLPPAARAPGLARGPTGSIGARRGARPIHVGFPSASACGRSARGRAVASERLGSGERRVHDTPGATKRAASSAHARWRVLRAVSATGTDRAAPRRSSLPLCSRDERSETSRKACLTRRAIRARSERRSSREETRVDHLVGEMLQKLLARRRRRTVVRRRRCSPERSAASSDRSASA